MYQCINNTGQDSMFPDLHRPTSTFFFIAHSHTLPHIVYYDYCNKNPWDWFDETSHKTYFTAIFFFEVCSRQNVVKLFALFLSCERASLD